MTTKRFATRADIETRSMTPGRARLWRIGDRLQRGAALSEEDAVFLAGALKAIAKGADASKVLGSAIARGRPRVPNAGQREMHIADAVEALRYDGHTLPDARKAVAKAHHLDVDTVKRYHEEHGRSARNLWGMIAKMDREHKALRDSLVAAFPGKPEIK